MYIHKLYKIFWLLFTFQIKIAIEPGAFHYKVSDLKSMDFQLKSMDFVVFEDSDLKSTQNPWILWFLRFLTLNLPRIHGFSAEIHRFCGFCGF